MICSLNKSRNIPIVAPLIKKNKGYGSGIKYFSYLCTVFQHAFEMVCLHHIPQIKQKLGISGVLSNVCSWSCKSFVDNDGTQHRGTQIDLIIDRNDETMNLCEAKFSTTSYAITQDYAERLNARKETFRALTGTRKSLHTTLITTYGVKRNSYSEFIQREVTVDDLFAQ